MLIVGAMRIRNEQRWIRRSIESILPICQRVHVFDDNSEDDTVAICESIPGVVVYRSPFNTTDEARDKNLLLDQVDKGGGADWIIMIDGDEVLSVDARDLACHILVNDQVKSCLSLPILYLWDREDQVRVDGVYGDFMRESAFRYRGERFERTVAGVNFHCGNVPAPLRRNRGYVNAPLLHFGYLHREDRVRKLAWYRELDPNNKHEDNYSHIGVGDEYPADSKFRHGGPLEIRPL